MIAGTIIGYNRGERGKAAGLRKAHGVNCGVTVRLAAVASGASSECTQIENRSDLANRMIVGDRLIETKLIEELFLLVVEPPHHGSLPSRITSQRRNH
jgi:hypothetical protein